MSVCLEYDMDLRIWNFFRLWIRFKSFRMRRLFVNCREHLLLQSEQFENFNFAKSLCNLCLFLEALKCRHSDNSWINFGRKIHHILPTNFYHPKGWHVFEICSGHTSNMSALERKRKRSSNSTKAHFSSKVCLGSLAGN